MKANERFGEIEIMMMEQILPTVNDPLHIHGQIGLPLFEYLFHQFREIMAKGEAVAHEQHIDFSGVRTTEQ
jgi:hypothetical protein